MVSVKKLIEYLLTLPSFTFKQREISNSLQIYRPISISSPKHKVLYKLAPFKPYRHSHLAYSFRIAFSPRNPEIEYVGFNHIQVDEAKHVISDLDAFNIYIQKTAPSGYGKIIDPDICEGCVYKTLCGEWGF